MNNLKILGISIDGIIRDFISQFIKIYKEQIGDPPKQPLNSYKLEEHFKFNGGIEEMNYFLYLENPLEIFGHANEQSFNVMNDIHKLNEKLKEHNCIIKLISKELGKSKPATLFFLSKIGCQIENIQFVLKEEEKWDYCDILLDVNPFSLKSKPDNKISIKFDTIYNKDVDSNYVIDDIKVLLEDNEFLNEIINYEFINYEEIK